MIDLLEAEKEFMNYALDYDMTDVKIYLKVEHTKRVKKVAQDLAKSLDLSKEQINLSGLIGLLHDIGRFEQIKLYNTFNDSKSIDHAEYGVKVLFGENLIRKFIQENKYDEIIKKAILNHNKYKIENGLTHEEMLYAKIIRDADKIDILRIVLQKDLETLYGKKDISEEKISDIVYETMLNEKTIKYKQVRTHLDDWMTKIAFCYDLNFDYSYDAIKSNTFACLHRIDYKDEETKKRIGIIEQKLNEFFERKSIKNK